MSIMHLLPLSLLLTIALAQHNIARCGPFYGYNDCPKNNGVTMCCSKFGFCSDSASNNADAFCAMQATGFYASDTLLCKTDAECATSGVGFVCSKDAATYGHCSISNVAVEALTGQAPVTSAAPVPTAAGKGGDATGAGNKTAAPVAGTTKAPVKSSAVHNGPTIVIAVAMITIAAIFL